MTRRIPSFTVLLLLALPSRALAFDYLEHSYFSDRACLEAQRRLAPLAARDERIALRYAALSLFCPESWKRPYCGDDYKQLEGSLNRLEQPPAEDGDHAITLGDFAALPDHLTAWGPIRDLPRADRDGMTLRAFEWLGETGDAGGVISDVAEDACETDELVDWPALEKDVSAGIEALAGPPFQIPRELLLPTARAELNRGPHDPAGPYSFDNPQYLDLVLRNHHHFGVPAWATWSGFHSAAAAIASSSCEARLAFGAGTREDLADDVPGFDAIDWDALDEPALRKRGCELLAEKVRLRLIEWSKRADPELVDPIRPLLARLAEQGSAATVAPQLVPLFTSLVFEGGGLHFLQDSLAGGHLRLDRSAYGLEDSRYEHDTDGQHGVAASVATRDGKSAFVAFGDSYLLGDAGVRVERCDWPVLGAASPQEVTACLLQHQRGLVAASSTAALLDWAHGGLMFEGGRDGCADADPSVDFACRRLPTRAPLAAGYDLGAPVPSTIPEGTLPVPPPPFSYQSMLFSTAVDASGGPSQLGVRMVFLSSLGERANWMTSYHVGLLTTLGRAEHAQVLSEFSYMFHWRWAARFLVNAGPFVYGGLRGFGQSVTPFTGVGPNVGISVLPEGWIRLPLEVSVSYRLPITLLDGRHGFSAQGIGIEAHWIELGLGLAFM